MTGSRTHSKAKGSFFDWLKGDKVIWMITLMLILFSIVCIFSSSSRLLGAGETRLDIFWDQVKVVLLGLFVIIACYLVPNFKIFRWCSKWGFLVSFLLLAFLVFGPTSGPVHASTINGARRIIVVGSYQIFVYEIVKVAMIMYFAWAVDAYKKKELKWVPADKSWAQKVVYLYLPFLIVTLMMLSGSNSAAFFIGGVFILTILIGLCDIRDFAIMILIGGIGIGCCFGLHLITDGKLFPRMETLMTGSRHNKIEVMEERYHDAGSAAERRHVIDDIRQVYSARIAIKEGGIIGKGPGQSTQRYMVPDFSEDFMYSFIVEEYGLIGGILIIILYVSLMARGTLIVKSCGKESFPKTAVAGLTMLITCQAFLHMLVNVGILPVTGQTLPLISHGAGSFICFCVAFGVLLSFSRIAQRSIEKAELNAEPIVDQDSDNVFQSVNELDSYDI